jgi:uncharacterized protein
MDVIPDTPLSNEEIHELDIFLMSDATPDECMDIVALDGFLTALAIGPELVSPSVWLPLVWGGEKELVFESSAQAGRIFGILMRRFNDICRMFGENATGFEPLLYTREVDGETEWIGEDWCAGFMEAVVLDFDDWQPLFDDKAGCALLAPILTLGTEIGWEELDASADPEAESEAALEALGPRWKPSLPTGGSAGAQMSWRRRTPVFALARSGRAGTTPARAEAGASSRNVALRAVPAESKHRSPSFLPSDVPYKQGRFHQTRQEGDQTSRILRASSGVATSCPIARIAATARSTIWRFVSWPSLPYW